MKEEEKVERAGEIEKMLVKKTVMIGKRAPIASLTW